MKTRQASNALLPRLVRVRDAANYLGMDRNRFNADVRPLLTRIPIGQQGIAFDRLELDAWVEDYISTTISTRKALSGMSMPSNASCRTSAI